MKDGWEMRSLGEVAEIGAGNPAPQGKHHFEGGTVPFIRTSDVGQVLFGEIGGAEDAVIEETAKMLRLVPEGTILLPKSGASTFLNHRVITTCAAYVASHLATVTPDPKIADDRYLLYALSLVRAQDLLPENAYPSLNLSAVKGILIPLPPLEEQRRIVAVLDEAFEGLARARANIEANLADAEEVFDRHLTFVLGAVERECGTRTLADLCERITVGHVGSMANRYDASGIPFLRSQNVRPFEIDLMDVKHIGELFDAELTKSRLRPGDVAIVRTGYPGTCAVIPDSLPVANCADLVIATPGKELEADYLALFLNSSFGKSHVSAKLVGAAQKHFNVTEAKRTPLPLPDLDRQRQLVRDALDVRETCRSMAKAYTDQLADLATLRQSLLARAFRGELT